MPGAERLIRNLRELGKRLVFLSNPTKDPQPGPYVPVAGGPANGSSS